MPEITTSGWVKFVLGILVVIFVLAVLAPIIKAIVDIVFIVIVLGLVVVGGFFAAKKLLS